MADNRTGNFLGGMVLGAAIGTITGLLIAPKSGRETRRILKKSADALPELAEDLSTSLQLQTDRLSESALHRWEGTLVRLRDAIAAGQEASRQELEELQQAEPAAESNRSAESSRELV
jgi:gas vesicle protein